MFLDGRGRRFLEPGSGLSPARSEVREEGLTNLSRHADCPLGRAQGAEDVEVPDRLC